MILLPSHSASRLHAVFRSGVRGTFPCIDFYFITLLLGYAIKGWNLNEATISMNSAGHVLRLQTVPERDKKYLGNCIQIWICLQNAIYNLGQSMWFKSHNRIVVATVPFSFIKFKRACKGNLENKSSKK